MTVQQATQVEPTLEEQVRALKETAARLAAERDAAFKMALQATKDLAQARREHKAELKLYDALIASVRIDRDDKHDEIRRLNARIRELAPTNEGQPQQLEATQQHAEQKTPQRSRLRIRRSP